MEDNGKLLPHIFMGSLTPILADAMTHAHARLPKLTQLLDFLDGNFEHGSEEIRELLSVSFLENLPEDGTIAPEVRKQLGPSLLGELRRRETWVPNGGPVTWRP